MLSLVVHLRSVDDQSVPLSFDVVVRRLFCDVEAGKLQLAGDFLLSFEHNQRNLGHKDTILIRTNFNKFKIFFAAKLFELLRPYIQYMQHRIRSD